MSKLLEKIINLRIRLYLKKINLFYPKQNGIRKNISTYNSLHTIQDYIVKTLETKQVLGLIALGIEKAYNTTWHPRILAKLHKEICNDKMLNLINDFLSDRTFQVNNK